jgi:hypothetical protein
MSKPVGRVVVMVTFTALVALTGACAAQSVGTPVDDGGEKRVMAATPAAVTLGAEGARAELVAADSGWKTALKLEGERGDAAGRISLVLSDLRTDLQPGVVYDVLLDLRGGDVGGGQTVGTLNFFGVRPGRPAGSKDPRFVSLDVTETALGLAKAGKLADKPRISIVPVGKPAAEAHPVVGRIELVRGAR